MPPVHFKPRERRMLQDEFDCHTRSREPRRRDFARMQPAAPPSHP
jgi:hypothetical protein